MKCEFSIATSDQIESALGAQLERIRLTMNLTQTQVAKEAGITPLTLRRLEKGGGVSMDTFIRVMKALGLQQNLEVLLPDPSVRPVERVRAAGKERQRARPKPGNEAGSGWQWGDKSKGER